jgi:hypothetical protein
MVFNRIHPHAKKLIFQSRAQSPDHAPRITLDDFDGTSVPFFLAKANERARFDQGSAGGSYRCMLS